METFATIPKYRSARFEYMWYQPWQAGYHDILKRGFPNADDQAILAELRSPNVVEDIDTFMEHYRTRLRRERRGEQ